MLRDRVRILALTVALAASIVFVPTPSEATEGGYRVWIGGVSSFSVPAFGCSTRTWTGYANLYTSVYNWSSNGTTGSSRNFSLTFCNHNPKTYVTYRTQVIHLTSSTVGGGLTCSASKTITVAYESSTGMP